MCSFHGRDDKYIKDFGWKNLERKRGLLDLCVDVRIILKWILEKWV